MYRDSTMSRPPTLMPRPPMWWCLSHLTRLHTQPTQPTAPYPPQHRTHPLLSPSPQNPLLPSLVKKTHPNTSLLQEAIRRHCPCLRKNSEGLALCNASHKRLLTTVIVLVHVNTKGTGCLGEFGCCVLQLYCVCTNEMPIQSHFHSDYLWMADYFRDSPLSCFVLMVVHSRHTPAGMHCFA